MIKMKKLLAFLDTLFPLILWIALLFSISQDEQLYNIIFILLIINDNIEKLGKRE